SGVARARVPVAGPRREHEQQPRVADGAHLVALARVEDREETGAARDRVVRPARDLDLALDDDEVRALVDLVVLELLAGRQEQRDRARLPAGGVEDDRVVRQDVEAAQVPVLVHAPMLPPPGARREPAPRAPDRAYTPTGERRDSASNR